MATAKNDITFVIPGQAQPPEASLRAARGAAGAVTRKVDGAVDEGVYQLSADALTPLKGTGAKLANVPAASDGGPLLVLVHGTFVDTVSTFGKLWSMHPQTVRDLFAHYDDRV